MQQRAVNWDCRVSLARLAKTRMVLAVARRRSHVNNTHAPRAHVVCPSTARRAVANPSATSEPGHGRAADIPTLQKNYYCKKSDNTLPMSSWPWTWTKVDDAFFFI